MVRCSCCCCAGWFIVLDAVLAAAAVIDAMACWRPGSRTLARHIHMGVGCLLRYMYVDAAVRHMLLSICSRTVHVHVHDKVGKALSKLVIQT